MIRYVMKLPEAMKDTTTLHGDTQDFLECFDAKGVYAYACGDMYKGTGVVQLHCTVVRNSATAIRGLREDLHVYVEVKKDQGYRSFYAMRQGVDVQWAKFVMALGFPAPEVFMATAIGEGHHGLHADPVLNA